MTVSTIAHTVQRKERTFHNSNVTRHNETCQDEPDLGPDFVILEETLTRAHRGHRGTLETVTDAYCVNGTVIRNIMKDRKEDKWNELKPI